MKLRNLIIHLIAGDLREPSETKSLTDFLQCLCSDSCDVSAVDELTSRLTGKSIERPLIPVFLVLYYLAFRKSSWQAFSLMVSHLVNESHIESEKFTILDNEILELYSILDKLRSAYAHFELKNIRKIFSMKTILGYSASFIDNIRTETTVGIVVKSLMLANFGNYDHIENAKRILTSAQQNQVHTEEQIEHYFIIQESPTDSVFLKFLEEQIKMLEPESQKKLKRKAIRERITVVRNKLTFGVRLIPAYISSVITVVSFLVWLSSTNNYLIPIPKSVGFYAGILTVVPLVYLSLVYLILPAFNNLLENKDTLPRFERIFF